MGSRCGCDSAKCDCSIIAGANIAVIGQGTPSQPYIITGQATGGMGGPGPVLTGNEAFILTQVAGIYRTRPATLATQPVVYVGPTAPTTGGTIAGGPNAVAGLDLWFKTLT